MGREERQTKLRGQSWQTKYREGRVGKQSLGREEWAKHYIVRVGESFWEGGVGKNLYGERSGKIICGRSGQIN